MEEEDSKLNNDVPQYILDIYHTLHASAKEDLSTIRGDGWTFKAYRKDKTIKGEYKIVNDKFGFSTISKIKPNIDYLGTIDLMEGEFHVVFKGYSEPE
jgi:hypothetical protein